MLTEVTPSSLDNFNAFDDLLVDTVIDTINLKFTTPADNIASS
jgi:hypothetical protein